MARRRRRVSPRKVPNLWFVAFQIVILIALLIAVLSVTESISQGTSALVESLASEDVQVGKPPDADSSPLSTGRTDDGAKRSPAALEAVEDPLPQGGDDAGSVLPDAAGSLP